MNLSHIGLSFFFVVKLVSATNVSLKRLYCAVHFDSMSKNEFLSYLDEHRDVETSLYCTIITLFDLNDSGFDAEECKNIVSSLLNSKRISWNGPERRISFAEWGNYDLSLRILATDEQLMKNPKIAAAVINLFASIDSFDRTLEGFRIILEGLAPTALPIHFNNQKVLSGFLSFAKIRRSGILRFLSMNADLKTDLINYSTSPIVREYLNAFLAHFFFFLSFSLTSFPIHSASHFAILLTSSLLAAKLFLDNFWFPFI